MCKKLKLGIIQILQIFQKEVLFVVSDSAAIPGFIFEVGQSLRAFLNSPGNWLSAELVQSIFIVGLFFMSKIANQKKRPISF